MIVQLQVHGKLAGISHCLSADGVTDKGFLHQDITAVFLVFQDVANGCSRPFRSSVGRGNVVSFQPGFYHADTVAGEELVVDPADNSGF